MGYKREDWLANNNQQPSNHVRTMPKSNKKAFTNAVTYSPPIAKTTRKNQAHTKAKPVVNKSHEDQVCDRRLEAMAKHFPRASQLVGKMKEAVEELDHLHLRMKVHSKSNGCFFGNGTSLDRVISGIEELDNIMGAYACLDLYSSEAPKLPDEQKEETLRDYSAAPECVKEEGSVSACVCACVCMCGCLCGVEK